MLRQTLPLAGLLLTALAFAPVGASDPVDTAHVVEPCNSIEFRTFYGDCDATLGAPGVPPLPYCYGPAIWPPTSAHCQVGTVDTDCAYTWTMVGTAYVPTSIDCVAREGLTGLGLHCDVFTDDNGWRGVDCDILGVLCHQALWGYHGTDLVVGGYNGCNFVAKQRIA